MLASDLNRAQSVSYERVHRLDQLSSFIPANLFESKSLTLKAAGRHRLTGIKVHMRNRRGRGRRSRRQRGRASRYTPQTESPRLSELVCLVRRPAPGHHLPGRDQTAGVLLSRRESPFRFALRWRGGRRRDPRQPRWHYRDAHQGLMFPLGRHCGVLHLQDWRQSGSRS